MSTSASPRVLFLNTLLLFCSLAFALVLLEITLVFINPEKPKEVPQVRTEWAKVPERVWTEHHPLLGWYHIKNHRAVLEKNELRVELHTNSEGLRGQREYAEEQPENIKRLLFLGDSFVFGWGVEDSDVFTARLEAEHPDYEVINLGVAGYGIDQIYLSYQAIGKKYKSDYVFVGIFYEDFWRATRAFADSGHAKPYFVLAKNGELILQNVPVPQPYTLKTDQFPMVVDQPWWERFLEKSRVYRVVKKALLKLARNLRIIDPDTTQEWVLGRAILEKLISEIRQDGATPVLFIVPSEYWAKNRKPTSLARSLHRFADKEEVEMLDTTPEFHDAVQAGSLSDYFIAGDGHWSARGHQLAADLVSKYLQEKGAL